MKIKKITLCTMTLALFSGSLSTNLTAGGGGAAFAGGLTGGLVGGALISNNSGGGSGKHEMRREIADLRDTVQQQGMTIQQQGIALQQLQQDNQTKDRTIKKLKKALKKNHVKVESDDDDDDDND